ncbi:MAG: hypothetical protein KJ556_19690 [Gammaproteobacteria bacterium]|nr:hypothetical protein [Gammaproteobacteria bacterium]MBU2056227.1 hypothetical protein [Gammaproteobacteria bacterium]MBU2177323.1 hypothetical protein [Gammaproteobacteria bacterium]MBU2248802.1 hypothetical protein [Gammaproteobacteria bacterium]MBU2345805.1 hypothetical protein [Gammaproteobacteria bacterium]
MKEISLFVSLVMISGVNSLHAVENSNNRMEQPLVMQEIGCSNWNAEKLFAQTNSAIPDFLKGKPSCLQDLKHSEFTPKQTEKLFREMHNRFYEIYDQLDDTKSKVEFTIGFIAEVSKIHQVGITKSVDGRYALRFGFKFNEKTMTRLMYITSVEKNGYSLTEDDYEAFGNSIIISDALESSINYVIHGKKNSLKQHYNANNEDGDGEEVDEFRDWASEQADATCESMGCDWDWSTAPNGEDYIQFSWEDDYGGYDFWEGYFYTPDDRYL